MARLKRQFHENSMLKREVVYFLLDIKEIVPQDIFSPS
jgi:hypothetical protein